MSGKIALYACAGGELVLPAQASLLADRGDGGNLVVNPPRRVWERSALSVEELAAWSYLVAASGEAMLGVLPQLDGGCINYWEAGNWALNDAAEPIGQKTAPAHRNVHLHLIGRSRFAKSPHHIWGESPRFPRYAERHTWAKHFARLTPQECASIVARVADLLEVKFAINELPSWMTCEACGYPSPTTPRHTCA